jgi:hypothetical protein
MEQTQANQERCIHGMKKVYCGVCARPEKPQATRVDPALRERFASAQDDRFLVISNRASLNDKDLPTDATHVHFVDGPSRLLIRKILELFPNLQVLNFAPHRERCPDLEAYRALLKPRNVKLQFEFVTGPKRGPMLKYLITDQHWLAQKARFFNLTPEQKAKLEEMIELGFDEAIAFKWYLLIDCPDQERISVLDVARLTGSKFSAEGTRVINGILYYLDPSVSEDEPTKVYARRFARRVEQLKKARSECKTVTMGG